MKRWMVPPLPAASRPSKTMTWRAPVRLLHRCSLSSSICSLRLYVLVLAARHARVVRVALAPRLDGVAVAVEQDRVVVVLVVDGVPVLGRRQRFKINFGICGRHPHSFWGHLPRRSRLANLQVGSCPSPAAAAHARSARLYTRNVADFVGLENLVEVVAACQRDGVRGEHSPCQPCSDRVALVE